MTNNNDFLSQEEIDALLNQSADNESNNTDLNIDSYLNSMEQDALGEIGNIAFGSSATALSTLLGKKVEITTPRVSVIARDRLSDEFPEPHVAVFVNYVEGFQGVNLLVIKQEDAHVIADLMLGGEGKVGEGELTEIHISAIQEAMNQMMGSAATSMSAIFNRTVNISPPGIDLLDFKQNEKIELPEDKVYIKVSFRLLIEGLIDSQIMQLLTVSFSKDLIKGILSGSDEATASAPVNEQPAVVQHNQNEPAAVSAVSTNQTATREQPLGEVKKETNDVYGKTHENNPVKVHPVQYASLDQSNNVVSGNPNLNLLMDIPLQVTVELGRAKKLVKEILEITHGSIIELDKLAGEPVDIMVNNKMIAKGEVVVIDENFGVRVTEIVSVMDRISNLQ